MCETQNAGEVQIPVLWLTGRDCGKHMQMPIGPADAGRGAGQHFASHTMMPPGVGMQSHHAQHLSAPTEATWECARCCYVNDARVVACVRCNHVRRSTG